MRTRRLLAARPARRRRRSSASVGEDGRRPGRRSARPRAEENGHEADGVHRRSSRRAATVDDCHEAPSPILPETNEIIWGAISFSLLFVLLWKVGYPAIKKGMDGRTERIRTDLESAESAKADAQRVLDEYRAQLADAKARVRTHHRGGPPAGRRVEARPAAAPADRAGADARAGRRRHRVGEGAGVADLRGEVASLAVGAAEVVVQKSLDRETQTQLVEQYIDSVANRSN